MLRPENLFNLPTDLPAEAANLQDPLQMQELHPGLEQKLEEKAAERHKKMAGAILAMAGGLALTYMGQGDVQAVAETIHAIEPVASISAVNPVHTEQHSQDQQGDKHQGENRPEAPDFSDIVRQIEESKESELPVATNHFKNGQYKHGTSHGPNTQLRFHL